MKKCELKNVTLNKLEIITAKLATALIKKPTTLFLSGDLGAGKTTFTQLLAKYLFVNDIVSSPTFNIMKRYKISDDLFLNHFDLYRVKGDIFDLGFEEYFYSTDINIIEWSNYLDESLLEIAGIRINILFVNEVTRNFEICYAKDYELCIKEIENEFIY